MLFVEAILWKRDSAPRPTRTSPALDPAIGGMTNRTLKWGMIQML